MRWQVSPTTSALAISLPVIGTGTSDNVGRVGRLGDGLDQSLASGGAGHRRVDARPGFSVTVRSELRRPQLIRGQDS